MNTRLYRSSQDRVIGGVAGGLGRYLGIDSTLVRIFFVLLALGDGVGVLLYLVLWLVLPSEDEVEVSAGERIRTGAEEMAATARSVGQSVSADGASRTNVALVAGATLIIVGVIYFIDNLNVPWLWWLDFDVLWPALLVIGGLIMVVQTLRREEA